MNQPKLYSLEFLRIYACVLVYRWHISRTNIDNNPLLIFFVLSGFVIAYRYFDRDEPLSLAGTLRFVQRRVSKFYLSHLLLVIAAILPQAWYDRIGRFEFGMGTPKEFFTKLLLSLTLTQSWSRQYHYCMNGVAWFISALAFFYLLTPLILAGLRKLSHWAPFAVIVAGCSVLYANIPGWMGDDYYSTCPLLYLPLYIQGLTIGSAYLLLLRNKTFANAKTARSWFALAAVGCYVWHVYAPQQMHLPWLLPFGFTDLPILLLVFGLAQDVGPIRILGNPVVQFFSGRIMDIYLVHQVWFGYVDVLSLVLLSRQIYWMNSARGNIVRLVGTLVLAEILHSVVPRVAAFLKHLITQKKTLPNN